MTVHEYDLKGYELLKKEDWDAAVEWYTTALAEHPDSEYLIGRRCDAWVRKGEPEKALAEYARQIEKNPPHPEDAEDWYVKNSNGRTRSTRDIRRADAYNRRGLLYQELGDYDKAIADFSEAIPLGWSNYGGYWTNRGIAYREKGDLDAALADMNAAIKAEEPDDYTSWTFYQRSLVWEKKGEPEKALADLIQATVNAPENAEAFYRLGHFWFNQKELEKAIESFSKAIELWDKNASYWLARGACYWNQCVRDKTGFWNEGSETIDLAEEDLTKAIECDPDMADAYFDRGMLRCSKAKESHNLIKAILTGKATDEAQRALLMAQLENIGGHDMVPQFDALLRGLRSDRDEVEEIIAKSLVLFVHNDAGEAIEDLNRAIELEPGNAEAYYQRGRAYSLLGEPAKAISDYEQTCALDPDHDKAAGKRDELLSGK